MYQLTREQKISNLRELISYKKKKLKNLEEEILHLETKLQKKLKSQTVNPVTTKKDSFLEGAGFIADDDDVL
jgi:hypothetical protein